MRHIPLVALISTSLILGACSLPFQGTKKVADVEPRHLLPKEVIAVTPNGLSIMHPTASTDNIEYANIDADKYKEALIIFNSGGCGESDKAHLVVLKYNQEEDAWKNMTTVVLAGKQGRIESFQEKPFDITGDGINDIEIASETNGCGGAWVLSKQVFSFRDGALQDLTDKAIFSVEGGYGLIKHVDKKYEVYAKLGEERGCNQYSLTLFSYNGQKFVPEKSETTTYKYKTKFNVTNTQLPDEFVDKCVTVSNNNERKLGYIREDALNHVFPSVVNQK